MSVLTRDELEIALNDRETTLEALDAADAEESLMDYTKFVWDTVEPVRPFVWGWAIQAICDHLTAVFNGEIRKLLMNVPPGFMKSLATSVMYPSWVWGPKRSPGTRFLCASYTQDLTIRDNVKARLVMSSPKYQRHWGDVFTIDSDQNAKQKFQNSAMGYKIATSVHGMSTGERGDCIIIDDPHNVLEAESDAKRNGALQWFTEVMPTRINDKKTASFIVIMQRVHELDVSGIILEKELGYTHLCIPMHHDPMHPYIDQKRFWKGWPGDPRTYEGQLAFPERYDEEGVKELQRDMMAWGGSYSVAGQLEQNPIPRGGGMVREDWFEYVDCVPSGFHTRCRGWDFAATEGGEGAGSASVKTAEVEVGGGDTDLYVEDVWWARVSPGGLYEHIALTVQWDGYDVFQSLPQDPGASGKYQVDDLLKLFSGYDFEFSLESGDKVTRFRPWAAQAETRAKIHRKIKIVRGPWNSTYVEHITKFPMGKFKDIPDAQSRSYGGIVRRGGGNFLLGSSSLIHMQGPNGTS